MLVSDINAEAEASSKIEIYVDGHLSGDQRELGATDYSFIVGRVVSRLTLGRATDPSLAWSHFEEGWRIYR